MTAEYTRRHRRPRARPSRPRAAGVRDDGRDHRLHRHAGRGRPRLRRRRRRLLPRALGPGVRQPLPPPPGGHGPGRGGGGRRAQAGPARLRPLEGPQGGRGHVVGVTLGGRPPGVAHRVLGDGRAAARRRLRDPRGRLGPAVPPPRERGLPDARRPRAGAGPAVDAQRDGAADGREDGQVGGQHRAPARAARRATTPRRCRDVPDLRATTASRWPSPRPSSRTPPGGCGASARRCGGSRRASRARRTWPSTSASSSRRCANDFNTPAALAAMDGWIREANRRGEGVGDEDLREMLGVLGLGRAGAAPERAMPPAPTPRPSPCWPSASGPARSATSRPPTASARSCASGDGRCATDRRGRS